VLAFSTLEITCIFSSLAAQCGFLHVFQALNYRIFLFRSVVGVEPLPQQGIESGLTRKAFVCVRLSLILLKKSSIARDEIR
jgi:hypothetical protein